MNDQGEMDEKLKQKRLLSTKAGKNKIANKGYTYTPQVP